MTLRSVASSSAIASSPTRVSQHERRVIRVGGIVVAERRIVRNIGQYAEVVPPALVIRRRQAGLVGQPVARWQIDQEAAFAVLLLEKLQVVPALPRLVVGARLVLEREAERPVVGRNVHRDVDAPALREPRAPARPGSCPRRWAEADRNAPSKSPLRWAPPGTSRSDRTGSPASGATLSSSIIASQKGRALTVLAGRIEQIGDDPREAELVVAEVAEDVEAAREVAIEFTLDRAGRVQMWSQFLQETDGTLAPGPAHVVQMVQEFGDGVRRWDGGLCR